ncbi:MAG TPA: ANTAR domain-containing protein [Pseudonocardia sp.]|jgi:hypothetical protein|nr:ANTAR domain-containing protein [Pseudonocardia sp.]
MSSENPDLVPSKDAPVYWAQGVLADMLGITVDEADHALRAHAEDVGSPLLDVAYQVVRFGLHVDPGTAL